MYTNFLNLSYDFKGDGVVDATVLKNGVRNVDFKLPDDLFLQGGELFTKDAVWGDWIEVKIIDVDGITYPAGTILKEYVIKWAVDSNNNARQQIGSPYVGKILKDMYIRCIYHSVGTVNNVKVSLNYYLHKKLV